MLCLEMGEEASGGGEEDHDDGAESGKEDEDDEEEDDLRVVATPYALVYPFIGTGAIEEGAWTGVQSPSEIATARPGQSNQPVVLFLPRYSEILKRNLSNFKDGATLCGQ